MPDTATALLTEVQADGLARERVLWAQLYSANEPLLVAEDLVPDLEPGHLWVGGTSNKFRGKSTSLLGHNPATAASFRLTLG
jgi:hypothetical protein